MALTTNYGFDKSKRGHQIREDDIGRIADNLDIIDAAIHNTNTKGTGNFAGQLGVTITHNLNISDYAVTVVQTDADPVGSVGEIWVTDIAVNSFVVRNSGSGVTSFTWIIHKGA